jgi:hypothetical protein
MSRQFARLMQHKTRRRKGDTAQLAAQLAPLEEQNKAVTAQQSAVAQSSAQAGMQHERGTIVVDTGNLVLPKNVETERESPWRIEPVVIVILGLMLLFIAFVAWQIIQSPWPPPPQ